MISRQPTDPLGEIYAQWAVEMGNYPMMSTQLLRIIFDDWQRATAEPTEVTYEHTEIGGVPGIRVTPLEADSRQMLILMHGGGFALGSSASHRKLAGHLAKACGAHLFVADFRLAPEHPFPAQIEDGLAVYGALLEQGLAPADITLVGDSAGGGLAIAMSLRLRDAGHAAPPQVITLSPWLDMENSGTTIDTNSDTDFLLSREGLQANIDRYLTGGTSPQNPLANPLYADFRGFPRLYICAGDIEAVFADSVRLERLARNAGVDVTFSIGTGMQHVYPMLAGRHPRADQELADIAVWYRDGRVDRWPATTLTETAPQA